MATRINSEEEFQKKIDTAFPASGMLVIPAERLKPLILAYRQQAEAVKCNIPHSRERSLAFSRLEESFIWSLLGIIRR